MSRQVFCQRLQKQAEGLDKPPYPNVLGQKIYENVSAEAWKAWLERQTMFINENRLNLLEPTAREFLMAEMKKFLFEGADNKPEGFKEK